MPQKDVRKSIDGLRDLCGRISKGGPGSGNFAHGGRPGEVGGSGPGGGGGISGKAASKLMDQIKGGGGFSYQVVKGSSPTEGYMVSPYKEREQVVSGQAANIRDLIRYTAKNKDVLVKPDHYFGGWMDGKDLYLDTSVHHDDREMAMATAEDAEQKAIFDVGKMESVYIQGQAR